MKKKRGREHSNTLLEFIVWFTWRKRGERNYNKREGETRKTQASKQGISKGAQEELDNSKQGKKSSKVRASNKRIL